MCVGDQPDVFNTELDRTHQEFVCSGKLDHTG